MQYALIFFSDSVRNACVVGWMAKHHGWSLQEESGPIFHMGKN